MYSAEQDSRLQNIAFDDEDFEVEAPLEERRRRLDGIAEGPWWRQLIEEFKEDDMIDFWDLELKFSQRYCEKLKELFRFILNMPIREREGARHLKYRMIHMTNHHDGCVLMNDNMLSRLDEQTKQPSLLSVDLDRNFVEDAQIEAVACEVVSQISNTRFIPADLVAAKIIARIGVVHKATQLKKKFLTPLEGQRIIERERPLTLHGRIATGWSDNKIKIRRIESS